MPKAHLYTVHPIVIRSLPPVPSFSCLSRTDCHKVASMNATRRTAYFLLVYMDVAWFCRAGAMAVQKGGVQLKQMVMTSWENRRHPTSLGWLADFGGATFLAPRNDLGCDGTLNLPLKRVCSKQQKKLLWKCSGSAIEIQHEPHNVAQHSSLWESGLP